MTHVIIYDACNNGNVNALLATIEGGEDLNTYNEDDWSPLMYASRGSSADHVPCMRILISNGANVNARDKMQSSSIHTAANNNNFDGINLLLDNGADIDPVDNLNETPLMWACGDEPINAARVLLERGANLPIQCNTK